MRLNPRTILITIFSMFLMLASGSIKDISAQGRGHGGGGGNRGGGGGQPQVQRQAPPQRQQPQVQRPQPQVQRQQAQRQMPQMQRPQPQMQRQMPQMQRQQPQRQAQQPRFERSQQVQRQQPRFERPQQIQRPQPQFQRQERQAQRREMPQQQRQQPQVQRQERQTQRQQQRPQFDQQTRANRGGGNQAIVDRGREARAVQQVERQRPSIMRIPTERGNRGQQNVQDRQASFQQERGSGRAARFDRQSIMSQDRSSQVGDVQTLSGDQRRGGNWQQQARQTDVPMFSAQNEMQRSGRGRWGRNSIDPSSIDLSSFRTQESAWRQQASAEGWAFNENDFRLNAYDYTVREAWRDDVLRSVINVNIGYPNDYYYIAPPSYPAYWGVNYQPWYYNVGYTYYDPYYSNYYVQPYYMAYAPYDYYYSSYYYDDPYYFNDPYDDYVTYRIFSSNSVGGFVTRLLGSLLATGYDQGYRDGLLARQQGYAYTEYYSDPYTYYYEEPQYETVTYYQPYLYGSYEDRHCLSKGYDLGYRDAYYGYNDTYDPYYAEGNIDIVSLYVGTTFTFHI